MKRFIIKSIAFLVGLVIIIHILSAFIVIDIYGDYYIKAKKILDNRAPCIILGDSHPTVIRQEHLDKNILNLSYDSDSLGDMYLKLIFCINNKIPITTILLQCDSHIFSQYRLIKNNSKRTILFSNFSDYNKVYKIGLFKFLIEKYVFPKLSLFDSNNNKVFRYKLSNKIEKILNHSIERYKAKYNWNQVDNEERKRIIQIRFNTQYSQPINPKLEKIFYDILKLCDINNIEVIGVRYPITQEYKEKLKNTNLKLIENIFTKSGIKIIDFTNYFSEDSLFADEDHLNFYGSKIFGKKLTSFLIKKKVI